MKKDELINLIFDIENKYDDLFVGITLYDKQFDKNGLGTLCNDGNGIKVYIGDSEGKDDYIIYYSYKPEYASDSAYDNAVCLNNLPSDRIYINELINFFNRQPIVEVGAYLES